MAEEPTAHRRGDGRRARLVRLHGTNNYTRTHCGTVGLVHGFIEDAGEHSRGYARWIESALERGIFGGAKRMGRLRRQIEAFRCPKCVAHAVALGPGATPRRGGAS